MSSAQVRALRAVAEPIAAQFDCDLEDVVVRPAGKRRLVRVVLDHDGGLTLDLVAAVSRALSRALDDSDPFGGAPFVLEVTSPGVERPLRLPRHWRRAAGRIVLVDTRDGRSFEGRVTSADDSGAFLDIDGDARHVGFENVARAIVQVEMTRIDEVELDPEEDPLPLLGAGPDLSEDAGPSEDAALAEEAQEG